MLFHIQDWDVELVRGGLLAYHDSIKALNVLSLGAERVRDDMSYPQVILAISRGRG